MSNQLSFNRSTSGINKIMNQNVQNVQNEQNSDNSGSLCSNILFQEFTTTGNQEKISNYVTMISALPYYLDSAILCGCEIPRVKIS